MKLARVALSVMLWILVLALSALVASSIAGGKSEGDTGWLSAGAISQATILIASLALILALSRGSPALYGLRLSTFEQIKSALLFGSIAAASVHLVLAVVWRLLPFSGDDPKTGGAPFVHIVIVVWVFASISEETFHRGLIQSFLNPLKEHCTSLFGLRLSLPVLVAALLFGLMHTVLLTTGAEGVFVGGIVASATVLGIIAGYYREKSGSIIPAILVHALFNIVGSASQYIQALAAR